MDVNIERAFHGTAWLASVYGSIPELDSSVTVEDVAAALKGSADGRLLWYIVTVDEYTGYRSWVMNLIASAPQMTPEDVKHSPNVWFSYALDCDSLLAAVPGEGDVKIVDFSKFGTGDLFEFNVNIKDIHIGDGALAGNLMKVFDVEGSENLLSGSFSADAAEVDAVMSKDGNVKFKVKPKANGGKMPDRFFFRVKMK